MSQVYKLHELTLNISAQSRTNIVTNTTFFTADSKTAKKIINFTLDNEPLDLTKAMVLLAFDFVSADASKIIDSKDGSVVIEDAKNGQCSVILPNHLYVYSGQVLVHTYIVFEDGRSFDAGVIVTEFEESWIDQKLDEMEKFYVKRFEDLANEIRERAEYLQGKLDNLQNQASYIQDQITSGELVTIPIHETHVNDTDNPHQVSIGQIPNLKDELDNRSLVGHPHNASDINTGVLDIARLPTGATSTTIALGEHPHGMAHITGLQDELDNKADIGHTHEPQTDIPGNAGSATRLQTARQINGVNFDGSSNITITANPNAHIHTINQVTNLQTELGNRSITGHTHTISRIVNLQTELDNRSLINHTHTTFGNIRFPGLNTIRNEVASLAIEAPNNNLNLRSGGTIALNAQGTPNTVFNVGRDSAGPRIWAMAIWNRTTSNSVNLNVGNAGTLLRVTSASKYKADIQRGVTLDMAKNILDLKVAQWQDKGVVQRYQAFLARRDKGEVVGNEDESDIEIPRAHYGLIAEDVVDAGLDMFVQRGVDGEIEGLEYERLWTLLIPLVRDQGEKIKALEARIKKLEGDK